MSKKIIIDANYDQIRVAVLSSTNNIENIEYESAAKEPSKGNIYLARISKVVPSLQAAFIEYGADKSGFLPFTDIHPDYYNVSELDQKSNLVRCLDYIQPNELTYEEQEPSEQSKSYSILTENEEIDISTIEKLVDEKIASEFNLEASDVEDVDTITLTQDNTQEKLQYKIQDVIKEGQILLVQLTKEKRGNKGASFTTYISIAGKHCVLMPNTASQNGVSRKISNAEERKRLKNIINKITSSNTSSKSSIIIRTAGIARTTLDIKRDYDYLIKLWNDIRETTLKSTAPCFIHEEDGIIQKTIRDLFDHNVKELLIQGDVAYKNATKVIQDMLPTELFKLKEYKGKTPIFTQFAIETQLSELYQPISVLPSGGYIVINPTEALIAIDVNSGRATSENTIEDTAVKTNLEATKEIARQIRLRDLSGLIVVDFIDMHDTKHKRIVERSFREFLSRDKARVHTANISQFGLLEMSRQRLRPSFLESNSSICNHCSGKGVVRADDSNAMLILRTIENEIFNGNVDIVNIFANMAAVIYLLNNKRKEISLIEQKHNVKLNFYSDPVATSDSYSIEKIRLPKKLANNVERPLMQNNAATILETGKEYKKNKTRKQKWNSEKQLGSEERQTKNNYRSISKLTTEEQVLGNIETENHNSVAISEDPGVGVATKTSPEVKFQKKSNIKNPPEKSQVTDEIQGRMIETKADPLKSPVVQADNSAIMSAAEDATDPSVVAPVRKPRRRNNFRKRFNKDKEPTSIIEPVEPL